MFGYKIEAMEAETKNMDDNLTNRINNLLNSGVSKDNIYKELLSANFGVESIENAFKKIDEKKNKEHGQRKIIGIIAIVGAISVAAGIFSFIASNWRGMDKMVKIAIILIAMVSFYGAGWFAREKEEHKKLGDALILLGAIVYGAGIFLIGQIFNISENWPDAFILWMIGVIATGFAVRIYALYYLALIIGFAPVVTHISCINRDNDCFASFSFFLLFLSAIIIFIAGWFLRRKVLIEIKNLYQI